MSPTRSLPIAAKLGRGWHVRIGPVLVSHYRPCSASPFVDEAFCTLTYSDNRPDESFHGWAVRWPRFSFATTGQLGRTAGWRHRRRGARLQRSGLGRPMMMGDCDGQP